MHVRPGAQAPSIEVQRFVQSVFSIANFFGKKAILMPVKNLRVGFCA